MIAPAIVAEIRRLLNEKTLSQRKIAQLTDVSHGTVGAIASGTRPDYEALRDLSDDDGEEPAGPPERCRGCGGMVYAPCRLCQSRKASVPKPHRAPRRLATRKDERPELELRPEHRARYEQVLAWRRENRQPIEGRVKP